MKRLVGLFSSTTLLILGLVVVNNASAECVRENGPGQVNASNSLYAAKYGAWIDVYAKTSGDAGHNCTTYRTVIDDYPTKRLTEETSEIQTTASADVITYNEGLPNEYKIDTNAHATATSSLSTATVVSSVGRISNRAYVSSKPEWVDLIKIENLTASPTDVNYIPVTFCSEMQSEYDTNGVDAAYLRYGDLWTGSDHPGLDALELDGLPNIQVTGVGRVCRTGHIKMTGQYVYFSLKMKNYTLGNYGTITVRTTPGNTTNVPVAQGTLTTSFDMGPLPSGATCESASGVFPGCERNKCSHVDQVAAIPENYTDYSNGPLSLVRGYRNHFVCEDNGSGVNWTNNYSRKVNFITTSESTTADVADENGILHIFREEAPGVWRAVQDGSSNTFEQRLDGSQALIGYVHTNASGIKDHYNLSGALTGIEHPTGETIALTYDAFGRISDVTESTSSDGLIFSYNNNDQISSITTPSGLISHAYDNDQNLASVTNVEGTTTYHYDNVVNPNELTGITDVSGSYRKAYISRYREVPITTEVVNAMLSFMRQENPDLRNVGFSRYATGTNFFWLPHEPGLRGKTGFKPTFEKVFDSDKGRDVLETTMTLRSLGMSNKNLSNKGTTLICNFDPYELFDFYVTLLHEHLHMKYGPGILDDKWAELRADMDAAGAEGYEYYYRGMKTTGIIEPLIRSETAQRINSEQIKKLGQIFCTCESDFQNCRGK